MGRIFLKKKEIMNARQVLFVFLIYIAAICVTSDTGCKGYQIHIDVLGGSGFMAAPNPTGAAICMCGSWVSAPEKCDFKHSRERVKNTLRQALHMIEDN